MYLAIWPTSYLLSLTHFRGGSFHALNLQFSSETPVVWHVGTCAKSTTVSQIMGWWLILAHCVSPCNSIYAKKLSSTNICLEDTMVGMFSVVMPHLYNLLPREMLKPLSFSICQGSILYLVPEYSLKEHIREAKQTWSWSYGRPLWASKE